MSFLRHVIAEGMETWSNGNLTIKYSATIGLS